ncbi:MAG: hypothetical protein LCH30_03120 [Proteobacteria bacterium]|nr:hypothetical protein [Pseudomonadota bacterium]
MTIKELFNELKDVIQEQIKVDKAFNALNNYLENPNQYLQLLSHCFDFIPTTGERFIHRLRTKNRRVKYQALGFLMNLRANGQEIEVNDKHSEQPASILDEKYAILLKEYLDNNAYSVSSELLYSIQWDKNLKNYSQLSHLFSNHFLIEQITTGKGQELLDPLLRLYKLKSVQWFNSNDYLKLVADCYARAGNINSAINEQIANLSNAIADCIHSNNIVPLQSALQEFSLLLTETYGYQLSPKAKDILTITLGYVAAALIGCATMIAVGMLAPTLVGSLPLIFMAIPLVLSVLAAASGIFYFILEYTSNNHENLAKNVEQSVSQYIGFFEKEKLDREEEIERLAKPYPILSFT